MGILKRSIFGLATVVVSVVLVGVAPAFAGSAWWGLTSGSWPSNLPAGGTGKIILTAQNRGDANVEAGVKPVILTDILPAGLTAVSAEGVAGEKEGLGNFRGPLKCVVVSGHEVRCTFEKGTVAGETGTLSPFEQLEARIAVKVSGGASSSEQNSMSVSGGGIASKSVMRPIRLGEETGFGVENYELLPEEEGGEASRQAGVHPFQLTSVVAFNVSTVAQNVQFQEPAGLVRDVVARLPAGLIGNPTPFVRCTDVQFARVGGAECPAASAIGVATLTYNTPEGTNLNTTATPIYNLVPLPGEPARFGVEIAHSQVFLNTSVRTGSDYGVNVSISEPPESAGAIAGKLTFWGVPGNPVHNNSRGLACVSHISVCSSLSEEGEPPPFLSLPTACNGPMRTTLQVDSWEKPKPVNPFEGSLFGEFLMESMVGCNHLQFNPEISVSPDVPEASTATGLEVRVRVPQTAALNPEGLAESALKDSTVLLPEGIEINPGGADGLQACSESQVGYLGKEPGEPATSLFTSGLSNPFCPNGSKIATVKITTPLLPDPLEGAVYLAAQDENPFGSLLAMYIVAEDPISGVLAKVAGEVSLDPGTGQILTTFLNSPEVPLEEIEFHFFGEDRAPLGTPALCGSYTTNATFSPWSGSTASHVASTFNIITGPHGTPCPNPDGERSFLSLPFAPTLTGGTTSNQAGGFSPFTITMSREDGNQNLKALSLHMPPGLLGIVSSVDLCGEAQADAGTCGPESEIGETVVGVGLGSNPFSVTGGKVFLTGPYEGAPYGLSIVNPADAGPFHLGNVVVRARIEVNPITADLTVTSDQTGPYAIPQMLDGIPLQIKHVNVAVNRKGFTFNPTNCEKLQLKGTLDSSEGQDRDITVPYQATNCATLGFKPKLTAATSAKPTRKNGTSLTLKITYPKAAMGKEAWFKEAKFDFPKQLPARLTTLQKACPAATFESNPAACPQASHAGTAVVNTPVLPGKLTGVVYFVSYGGAKFPEAVIVLQGDNVTVDLHAETFISKAGVTSATLRNIPGVPFENVEVNLPAGPYSEFAANGNPCTQKLKMPIAFTAQNGRALHESVPITVRSCPKARATKKKTKTRTRHVTQKS